MRWKLYAINEKDGILESPRGEQIPVSFTTFTRLPLIQRDGFDKVTGRPPPPAEQEMRFDLTDERPKGWVDPWPLLPEKTADEQRLLTEELTRQNKCESNEHRSIDYFGARDVHHN